jgi:hypothetical protein
MPAHTETPAAIVATCDICHQPILSGEKFSDDGSEIAHTACVRDWFRRNFGRDGL